MTFDRKGGLSMQIIDVDDPEGTQPIRKMLGVGKDFLIFKTNSVYKVLLAQHIDPDNTEPDTKHSYQKIFSVGSSNSFVARMILQFNEILESVSVSAQLPTGLEKLKQYIWNANQLLLECENSHFKIYQEAMSLAKVCDDVIEKNKGTHTIPTLPQVADLQQRVLIFFSNAKKFLVASYDMIGIFYSMPSQEANFMNARDLVKKNLGGDHPICKVLLQDENWVRLISNCRNAIEHPQKGLSVEIENFKINPGNKFSQPAWRFDLTKVDLGKQEEFTCLVRDLDVHLSNMLSFFEELLLICIKDLLGPENILLLSRVPDEKINKECPILFRIGLDSNRVKHR